MNTDALQRLVRLKPLAMRYDGFYLNSPIDQTSERLENKRP